MCLLLLSCANEKDELVENRLWLSHTEIEFSHQAGTQEVIVVADSKWEFLYDADWIQIHLITNNSNDETLWIFAKTNNEPTDRNTKIVVSLSETDVKKEIIISQKGNSSSVFFSANATVLGRGLDCGDIYLIQFNEDTQGLPYPFDFFNGIYYAMNLPQRYKIQGKTINVTFRQLYETETVVCTTMGPGFPFIYIVRVNSIPNDGIFSGIFTVKYFESFYWEAGSGEVTIKLKNGRFYSTANPDGSRIPAGGSGTFSVNGDRITFNDENGWFANFDWNLILNGEYDFVFDGKRLRIWRETDFGLYEYILEKQ